MQQSIQICTFYLRGSCRFGNKCWNLHDLTAYKSPKVKPNIGGATGKIHYEFYYLFSEYQYAG